MSANMRYSDFIVERCKLHKLCSMYKQCWKALGTDALGYVPTNGLG